MAEIKQANLPPDGDTMLGAQASTEHGEDSARTWTSASRKALTCWRAIGADAGAGGYYVQPTVFKGRQIRCGIPAADLARVAADDVQGCQTTKGWPTTHSMGWARAWSRDANTCYRMGAPSRPSR